ncbi:calpastatin isoform X16 [Pygocentrus nattereri]|uniref:calpastatin isoform X16 n=1 Tax=Pygocentrus nattereri TaxID=42514 RepID=UPI001890C453|nr:calpastatin isoform X16 [Pygocentrus nattereri]
MGQFFSWFRGSQETPALQDIAVEQQVNLTGYKHSQISSQAKQPTPTPAAPVSTVKPAEYEMGSASASAAGSAAKPGTTAPSAASTAASTAPTSTAATVSAGVSTGAKVSGGVSTGASVSGATPTGAASNLSTQVGASKVSPQTTPISSAKVPPVSAGSGAASGTGGAGATGVGAGAGKPTIDPVKPKDISKDKVQNTIISSSKLEPSKVTSTGVGSTVKKDDAKSKESKVRVEVPPPATKNSAPATAVDPFDALAGSLPSSEPLAPKGPRYTGPEIKEPSLTSEEAKRCGEKEHTLPPGYRKEDMEKKMPAGKPDKPKEVSKPLTEDDALDSLSAGFVSSAVPSAPKTQATPPISSAKAPTVSAGSGAMSGKGATGGGAGAGKPTTDPVKPKDTLKDKPQVHAEAAPPAAKAGVPEKKVPAGVSDKPKEVSKPLTVDEAVDSLSAGFVSSAVPSAPKPETKAESVTAAQSKTAPPPPAQKRQDVTVPTNVSPAPPADKKARVEKSANDSVKAAPSSSPAGKPKTDEGDPMSLDALSALEDTLPAAKPAPESPKLRPEDIVDEKKAKAEKGVRVGEREDTRPPAYRFSEEKHKERPAPPKEPSMDPAEALDILSGDFTSPSVAPAVQAPVPPSAPAKQQPKVEELSALEQLAGDFVAPAQAKKVASVAPPPAAKSTVGPTSDEGDPMSLDALSALGDTLPTAKPVPKSPELRPEDIVDEKKLSSEKGMRVGERDDTLPPDYRFFEEASKKYPAPPKEPSLDTAEALDILSGDFTSPSVAPAVQAPVPPSAPPADSSADFALEELAGDFVAPTAASKVHSAVTAPRKADRQLSEDTTSAMDALSDTLKDIGPAPQPVPVAPKDIVKEKEAVEEKITKAGERDDTLPPDYRPTEADIKAAAEAKAKAKANVPPKQTSMDESTALDALSSDFSAPPVAAPSSHPHTPPAKTPPIHSAPAASGPALDKLATTLLPDLPETKPKDSKPKVKGGKSKSKPKKPAVDDAPTSGHLSGQPSTDVVSTSSTKKGGKS